MSENAERVVSHRYPKSLDLSSFGFVAQGDYSYVKTTNSAEFSDFIVEYDLNVVFARNDDEICAPVCTVLLNGTPMFSIYFDCGGMSSCVCDGDWWLYIYDSRPMGGRRYRRDELVTEQLYKFIWLLGTGPYNREWYKLDHSELPEIFRGDPGVQRFMIALAEHIRSEQHVEPDAEGSDVIPPLDVARMR